ncbi:unnamed protein product [Arctogadus glacialis]
MFGDAWGGGYSCECQAGLGLAAAAPGPRGSASQTPRGELPDGASSINPVLASASLSEARQRRGLAGPTSLTSLLLLSSEAS